MKNNYRKLLFAIVGLIELVSVLVAVPSQAKETRNPRPSIFNEPSYNRFSRSSSAETTPILPTPIAQSPSESPSTAETQDLVALMQSEGSFTTLLKALEAAGLLETLKGGGPFTIFAPTDAAFNKLPPDQLKKLLQPENKEVLLKLLTHYVVPGELYSGDLEPGELTSVQGEPVSVEFDSVGYLIVNGETVVGGDIPASNGVMHVIDTLALLLDM